MRQPYDYTSKPKTQRNTRMPRFPFGVSMPANTLTPINYQHVNPGETLTKLSTQGRMISEPVKKLLTPSYFENWTFYVPYRLADENFVDFLLNEEDNPDVTADDSGVSGGSNITANRSRPFVFMKNNNVANRQNHYFPLALAAIYNSWFNAGDPVNANLSSYAVIPTLPHVDQLAEHSALADKINVPLPDNVEDLHKAQREYEYKLSRQTIGNESYNAYLENFGIKPERGLLFEPELILKRRHFVYPSRQVGHTNGNLVGQYQYDFEANMMKPKMFEEHGLLINCVALRPEVFYDKAAPLDAYRGLRDHFVQPLSDDVRITLNAEQWLEDTDRDEISLNQLAHLGEHFVGDLTPDDPADRPPISTVGTKDAVDDDLWDLANFQYNSSSDADKLRKVAYASGVTRTHIKSHVMKTPHGKTRDNSRR